MNKVAAIQMASGPNVSANLIEAERLIAMAVDSGAKLVVLPENFALMGVKEQDKLEHKEVEGEGPIQKFLSSIAKKHAIWIVGGTIPLESDNAGKIRAACLVYDDQGKQVARYDKIHLFDVSVPGSPDRYAESETIQAGEDTVVVQTPFGKVGLAICYDLRFPELFRGMLTQDMDIIALPSAFTAITGRAHWEVLVRARAIENLCYVVAAGQGGFHLNGRETYGDSMIVDPWGVVLDRLPTGSGVVVSDIDLTRVKNTRKQFPVLEHRQLFCKPK